MPSLVDEIRKEVEAQEAKDERVAREANSQQINEVRIMFARLNALSQNEEVKWFLEHFIKPLAEDERKKALDPSTASKQGAVHANRHQVADEAYTKLDTQLAYYAAKLEELAGQM